MIRIIVLFIFVATLTNLATRAMAEGLAAPTFTDASERMMTVQLATGQTVSENMPLFPSGVLWYLPLGELARNLGVEIEVTPADGIATGTLKTGHRFWIRLNECKIQRDLKIIQYPCSEATVRDDVILITETLLEKILPVRVEVNSFRSDVTIEPQEAFVQLPAEIPKRRLGPFDPGYPRLEVPGSDYDGVFVDQQIGYFNSRNASIDSQAFHHDTAVTGELLGMDASAFVDGGPDASNAVQNQRYTLAKRRVGGGLLGPLSASEYQLVDVTFPSLPMIGGGGVFRGGLISSFPLQNSSQFSSHDFNGDLPAGWEVELYQNDILIDRKASVGGRYEFKTIPLTYGENRFRLAFYGPQGQRRESFETYSVDSSFLPPGAQGYRVAMADDVGANARWLMQYDRSLAKNVNIFSAASRFSIDPKSLPLQVYGLLGARAYVKNLLLTSSAASNDQGGTAWENSIQAPLKNASVGAGYVRLSNFSSELYKLDHGRTARDVFRSNVAFDVLSAIRFNLEGSHTIYQDDWQNDIITGRFSTKTGPVQWFNTLNYDESALTTTGELKSITQLGRTEVQLIFGYDNHVVNTGDIETQTHVNDIFSFGVGWIETFAQGIRKQSVNLTRQFTHVALTANASIDNVGGAALGALLSYSFGREPRENTWTMEAKPRALLGSVSVFAYYDLNQNGIHDPGEPVLENAEVLLNQQPTNAKTSQTGIAVLNGLPIYEPADISLNSAAFSSTQIRPVPKGVRVFPQPGKMLKIDFPIIVYGEIAGFVRVKNTGGLLFPKRGIRVILRDSRGEDIKYVQTDSDGLYLIDDIKAGKYEVVLDSTQLRGLRLGSETESYTIEVGPQGIDDDDRDFTLDPKRREQKK